MTSISSPIFRLIYRMGAGCSGSTACCICAAKEPSCWFWTKSCLGATIWTWLPWIASAWTLLVWLCPRSSSFSTNYLLLSPKSLRSLSWLDSALEILSEESWASSSIIEGQFLKGGECASGETPFSSLVDYLNRLCFLRVSVSIRSSASPLETLGWGKFSFWESSISTPGTRGVLASYNLNSSP